MMDVLSDNIRKLFLRFLLPSVGGAVAIAAYSLIDTIVIGQGVGAIGTAALAVFNPVFCLAQAIGLILGVGGSVLMTKGRGQERYGKANAYYTATIILTATVSIIAWILMLLFQKSVYIFFGADQSLLPYVSEYGKWIVAIFPLSVIIPVLSSFIRCDGNPKQVMVATLIGAVINIFGDWFLVFPMKMGMTGAAIATAFGSVVQAAILICYCFTQKCNLKFEMPFQIWRAFRKIIENGMGSGISQISIIVVSFITNNQIMKYANADSLAIYGMLSTIGSLLMGVYTGVGQAVQPIASANYGAEKKERYWQAYKVGMITAATFGFVFLFLCELLPMEITHIFMKTNANIEMLAPNIVRVYGASFFPLATTIFVVMYLQCINKAAMASGISILRGLILNSILLYLLPLVWQSNGIWWAIFAAEYIVGVFAFLYLVVLYKQSRRC